LGCADVIQTRTREVLGAVDHVLANGVQKRGDKLASQEFKTRQSNLSGLGIDFMKLDVDILSSITEEANRFTLVS